MNLTDLTAFREHELARARLWSERDEAVRLRNAQSLEINSEPCSWCGAELHRSLLSRRGRDLICKGCAELHPDCEEWRAEDNHRRAGGIV